MNKFANKAALFPTCSHCGNYLVEAETFDHPLPEIKSFQQPPYDLWEARPRGD